MKKFLRLLTMVHRDVWRGLLWWFVEFARGRWERVVERSEVLDVRHCPRARLGLGWSTVVRSVASQWIVPGAWVESLRRGLLVSMVISGAAVRWSS